MNNHCIVIGSPGPSRIPDHSLVINGKVVGQMTVAETEEIRAFLSSTHAQHRLPFEAALREVFGDAAIQAYLNDLNAQTYEQP